MTRTIKRGYIEKGWFDPRCNAVRKDEFAATVSKVIQTDEFGGWEDEFEDTIRSIGGFKTVEEAEEFLKGEKVKEIVKEDF